MNPFYGWRTGNLCCSKAAGDNVFVIKKALVTNYECIHLLTGDIKNVSSAVIRGVPLTIDRILKLHFTKVDKCYVYNNCWVRPYGDGGAYVEFGKTLDNIRMVHELQNLYFKEAGHELPLPFLKYNVMSTLKV